METGALAYERAENREVEIICIAVARKRQARMIFLIFEARTEAMRNVLWKQVQR